MFGRLTTLSIVSLMFVSTFAVESPLSLRTAESLAVASDPKVKSISAEISAMRELAEASSDLPDTQVRLGLLNFPFEGGNFSTEAMTQFAFGVRQMIPPRGQRGAMQEIYNARALEKEHLLHARQNDIRLAVREAWLEAHYQNNAVMHLQESYEHFEDLVAISQSLYSVGTHSQEDVLLAQVNLSRMDDQLLQTRQHQEEAYAKLGYLLHTKSSFQVGEELPNWTIETPIEELKVQLLNHSETLAVLARSTQHEAAQDLVNSSRNPTWAIDLGYGLRDGSTNTFKPRSDVISLSISFSLPMLRKEGRDHRLQSASLLRAAALEDRTLLLREMEYQLDVAFSRWNTLSERLGLYTEDLTQQISELANTTLTSYQNKTTELTEAIARYIEEIEHLLAVQKLKVDRLKVWAKVDWLTEGGAL